IYTNAWHLGLGRLIACFAAEDVANSGGTGKLRTQVSYLWESLKHELTFGGEEQKKPIAHVTIVHPMFGVNESCFTNPLNAMRILWNEPAGASACFAKPGQEPLLY